VETAANGERRWRLYASCNQSSRVTRVVVCVVLRINWCTRHSSSERRKAMSVFRWNRAHAQQLSRPADKDLTSTRDQPLSHSSLLFFFSFFSVPLPFLGPSVFIANPHSPMGRSLVPFLYLLLRASLSFSSIFVRISAIYSKNILICSKQKKIIDEKNNLLLGYYSCELAIFFF